MGLEALPEFPCPQKSLSQFLLLPLLSSSSFPSLFPSCTLAHSLKVWGRGGAVLHRQPELPAILLFWVGPFLFFSQSLSFLPSLSSLTQPLPLLSLLWLRVQQVLSAAEKTERRAGSVGSIIFLLFFALLSVHLFCVASIFSPLVWPGKHLLGRVLSAPLFSFIPRLILRLPLALRWRASFHVCNSRPSRMRIIAAACSCHNPVGCSS